MRSRAVIAIISAIIAIAATLAVVFLLGIGSGEATAQEPDRPTRPRRNAEDALQFKLEHEVYNTVLDAYGNPRHHYMYIPENNRVVYLSFDELVEFIESGTGVFFFSRATCPWCRVALPTFLQVAEDMGMFVHYYDIDYDRDAHNDNYMWILEVLHDYLPVDDRNQTPGTPEFDTDMKRVTVPHFFFVKDGQVVNEKMMNRHPLIVDEDFDGLYDFFMEMFESVLPEPCEVVC